MTQKRLASVQRWFGSDLGVGCKACLSTYQMSSSIESEESINDIGSDAEMSTYSSGSELSMDLLTRDDGDCLFNHSRIIKGI